MAKSYREAGVLDRANDSKAFLEKFGALPLLYHPGERWAYSVAVDVLGVLAERVSGEPLNEFLKSRIFMPH